MTDSEWCKGGYGADDNSGFDIIVFACSEKVNSRSIVSHRSHTEVENEALCYYYFVITVSKIILFFRSFVMNGEGLGKRYLVALQ